MAKPNPLYSVARIAVCATVFAVLAACGGGGGDIDSEPVTPSDPAEQVSSNSQIASDPGTPEFTPNLAAALPVAYQDPGQDVSSSNEYIGAQWAYMQTCLQVSAQEPGVLVVDGALVPTDVTDDVIRHIDGQIQASSHVTDTNATIQVRAQDFDGSLGKQGSYLRSIMGRYLWLANSLAERDYPYHCAKGQ